MNPCVGALPRPSGHILDRVEQVQCSGESERWHRAGHRGGVAGHMRKTRSLLPMLGTRASTGRDEQVLLRFRLEFQRRRVHESHGCLVHVATAGRMDEALGKTGLGLLQAMGVDCVVDGPHGRVARKSEIWDPFSLQSVALGT